MCGIIAILRKPAAQRQSADELAAATELAFQTLRSALSIPEAATFAGLADATSGELAGEAGHVKQLSIDHVNALATAVGALDEVVATVRTPAGVRAMILDGALLQMVREQTRLCTLHCDAIEAVLDASGDAESVGSGGSVLRGTEVERANAALLAHRDALWNLGKDGVAAAEAVQRILARSGASSLSAVTAALSIHQSLSALDRMEVRGRDSAGLSLLCGGHALDIDSPQVRGALSERNSGLFENRAARLVERGRAEGAESKAEPVLSLVFKVAKEIGELGDNVSALRRDIEADDLLAAALRSEALEVAVLGHTRWASVGLITEPNAHPLNNESVSNDAGSAPYSIAVHNGDVDNHADLEAAAGLEFADEITTDTKVIPALVSQRLAQGARLEDAFQKTVASFRGSVAIALQAAQQPNKAMLALYGSGQALYVGLAEDAYIVASEIYGLVELCDEYVRLDGEVPGNPDNPTGSRGQLMALDGERAGTLEGLTLTAYDGTPIVLDKQAIRVAEITTRDVDRGDYPISVERDFRGAAVV